MGWILSSAIILGQSWLWNKSNEVVFHIPQISKAEDLPSDSLISYKGHSLWRVLPNRWDAVGVFYNSSLLHFYDFNTNVIIQLVGILRPKFKELTLQVSPEE